VITVLTGNGTPVCGLLGWGATPLKEYRRYLMVGSVGTEIRRRGQDQKPA
jgi:hypothetical protein